MMRLSPSLIDEVMPSTAVRFGDVVIGDRALANHLTGPFSVVREQVTGNYAHGFADRGYVALSFDHRNWGDSEGLPRQHEYATAKVADLRHAVSFFAAPVRLR